MKKHNLILIGVDSLWADHMSGYGYPRLTTLHIDRFAAQGVLFERNYSPHIPTTSAYATMLTGMDCFSHQVVALRHQGGLTDRVRTLPEILRDAGYATTCVGFSGNPSSRGFETYLNYPGWGSWAERPSRKAEALNDVALPELERLAQEDAAFVLFVLNGDHGETLMDHECYFDHHGMYDCTLHVPLIMRHPKLPAGRRCGGYTLHQDLVPTLLELLEVDSEMDFDGQSLLPMIHGE